MVPAGTRASDLIKNFAQWIVRLFATNSSPRNAHWQSFAILALRFFHCVACVPMNDRDVGELFSVATSLPYEQRSSHYLAH